MDLNVFGGEEVNGIPKEWLVGLGPELLLF